MARPHPALIEIAAGRPLPDVDDTGPLLRSSAEHRMEGLLWSRVEAGDLRLPPSQACWLARRDLWNRGLQTRQWHTLEAVTTQLAEAGIDVASAKGATAATRWYDRAGERPSVDVDLLVAPHHVHRMEELILRLHETPHAPDLAHLLQTGLLQSIDLVVDRVDVDLHTDILKLEIPLHQPTTVWEHTTTVSSPRGRRLRALDAEMSLIQFLLHLNKDRFNTLLGYADVARLVQREHLDWDFVERFLRSEGLLLHAQRSLAAVVNELRLPITPALSAPASDWRSRAWDRLWPPDERLQGPIGLATAPRRQLWIPWLARGRARQALRWWVRRRVLPPPALASIWYEATKGPYLWRLVAGRARRALERRAFRRAVIAADADRELV